MKRCKLLRMMSGKTQAVAAKDMGMHVSSLSSIETGRLRPYPGQVRKIAAALGWEGDPAELFEEVSADEIRTA